mgnify:CR=1 FL=1|tara:strand:- start:6748 stop:6936 length:189 start_codon:yes stop_codon:yes gene_type:complete
MSKRTHQRKQWRLEMTQPQSQQSDKLRFQKKSIKDQAETIKEQEKRIAEWIEQQQDPRHNQD